MDTNSARRHGRERRSHSRDPRSRRTLDDWRVICSCQAHSRRSGSLRGLSGWIGGESGVLRNPYAALLLSVPIAFGAVGVPASEVTAHHARTEVSAAASTRPAPEVRVAEEMPNAVDDLIHSMKARAIVDDLRLQVITPAVRQSLLANESQPDQFTLEVLKAEFFRTEIPYGSLIYREAKRNGFPPELIAAVVEAESDFRVTLISRRNAQGLMQIIPSTGELMGATNLMNPDQNVRAGTKYLKYLYQQFGGDMQLTLAAYNAGEAVVRRYGGIPPYRETQDYVRRVARSKQRYQHRLERRLTAMTGAALGERSRGETTQIARRSSPQ